MRIAVEARELSLSLGGRQLLRNLDLRLELGSLVALRGANGAGKSTLLNCLAGLLRPTAGEIFWFGQPRSMRASPSIPIGYVSHESFLYPELTARENLLFVGRMLGVARLESRVQAWIERIDLVGAARRPVERLSRGMRQRLSIARALLHDPPLVLMDEPFSDLDDGSRAWLMQLLQQLRKNHCAILYSSHHDEQCSPLANRIVRLFDGRLQPDRLPAQAGSAAPLFPMPPPIERGRRFAS